MAFARSHDHLRDAELIRANTKYWNETNAEKCKKSDVSVRTNCLL
jgi:hypothetical protein